MEIYRAEQTTIALPLPVTFNKVTSVKVVGTDGVEFSPTYSGTPNEPNGGMTLNVTLLPTAVAYDGVLKVTIQYDNFGVSTIYQYVSVVTPYMHQSDFVIDDDFLNMDPDKFKHLERMVRNVINTYTGQTFGLVKGTINATWSGKKWIITPPAVTIDSFDVSSEPVVTYPTIGGDVLNSYYEPKTDTYAVRNIYNPWAKNTGLKTAPVTGTFGYEYVPFDVHDAAMHLAEMFGCDETLWRDRYLRSMGSADVRVTYTDGAYAGTGSVYADQLLEKYQTSGLVVL